MSVPVPQSDATLALDYLFDRLTSETAERLDPAPVVAMGWRQPTYQVNQGPSGAGRVLLVPGDPGGKVGDLISAKRPQRDPAPVATLVELATLYLWAYDGTDPSDARLQWRAARRLHDVVVPIVIRAFRGRWKLVSNQWLRSDLERPFGAELQLVIAVEAMLPDDLVPQVAAGIITGVAINGAGC